MASNPDPLPKTYTRRPRVQRSSSLDSSATPEPISKQPFLYRMRGAFSVLLLANLLVGGYLLSKSSPRKRKGEKGDGGEKDVKPLAVEAVSEQKQSVHSESSRMDSTEHVPSSHQSTTNTISLTFSRSQKPPELTAADRQKLLEWMLESKRKQRHQNGAGKAQNDADKRLIKDVLSGKASWPF